jgi:Predicted nucleoside-diphosphate-sugar epimerases
MIVITTPTGQIGRQVLGNLLDSGEQLRVITRDPSQLPAEVRGDLDIVEGSHGDAAVVDKAFAGADAAFWLTPADPGRRRSKPPLPASPGPPPRRSRGTASGASSESPCSAAARPGPPRAGFVTGSLAMDDLIAASGVAYRALTNPYFMENTVLQAESIKNQGLFFSPIAGDRKLPAVATRDIAAAASRLLLDASWTGAGEVPLLGPEDLSYTDMAEIMSQVLGKDVRFQQITFEAYKDGFIRLGMSDAMAQGYTDMAWAKNEGLDNGVQRTPENSTPTSFRQWCEEVLKPTVAS